MNYEVRKICRVCLEEGQLTSLFTNEVISPSFMIMTCTAIKVKKNDGMPSEICSSCVQRLNNAFQFKKQCESSDHQLRKYFNKINIKESHLDSKNESTIPTVKFFEENVIKDDIYDAVNVVCEMLAEHAEKMENKSLNGHQIIDVDAEREAVIDPSDISVTPSAKRKNKKSQIKTPDDEKKKRNNLNKKYARAKPKQLKEPEKCFDCGRVFNYSGYLEAHIRTHTGEKPYECNICQKKFTQMGNLALHMRTHTGEKPFQCEICSKQFTTSSNLHAHFKIHTQVRNYQCPECPRAFKSSRELSNHAGIHTGVKNQICKICGKAFYKISYLNIHLKTVHVGEKNHKCAECGKEFSNSSNLTCHYRIHTGEKPFSCMSCGACFNQSSALHRHRKQHQSTAKKRSVPKNVSKYNTPLKESDNNLPVIAQIQNIPKENSIVPIELSKTITYTGCEPGLLEFAKTQTFHDNYIRRQSTYILNT